MKKYQKPAMLALSLSANDTLCSSCGVQTRFDPVLSAILDQLCGTDSSDGIFTPAEAESVYAFTSSEDTCTKKIDYQGYCKYTSAEATRLFTS